MEEHIKALFCRIVLAVLVLASLPFVHMQWGESPEAAGIDGPAAFAILIGMAGWSFLAAIVYFFIGCLVQAVFRHRLQIAFYYDIPVGILLIVLFAFAGVTAHYQASPP